jgi:hypothetical protein
MGSLGNRTFQGLGLSPEVARRLDDLIQQISTNQTQIQAATEATLSKADVTALAAAAAKSAINTPGTVLNITNATGQSATPQPASIPVVSSFPAGPKAGQAVYFQNSIWIWSGSAWLPDGGLALIAHDTATLTLTSAYQDIVGLTVTLARAGLWLIHGHIGFALTGGSGAGFLQLNAGGSPQTPTAPQVAYLSTGVISTSQSWLYTASPGAVAKLQAKSASGGGTTDSAHTGSISAVWIHG